MNARDRFAAVSWSVRVTRRRAHNRIFDLLGVAAGYCMAAPWQPMRRTYAPGYAHWRCYLKTEDHASGWHRSNNYRWLEGQPPIFDPAPVRGPNDDRRGAPPRWLRARHFMVGTRARDRQRQAYVFEQHRAMRQRYAAAAAAQLSGVRATADKVLADALREEVGSPDAEHSDPAVRGVRPSPRLRHTFRPGQAGTHLEIYCQALAEAGTSPVPGFDPPTCGWPETRHPSAAQMRVIVAADIKAAAAEIFGDDITTGELGKLPFTHDDKEA